MSTATQCERLLAWFRSGRSITAAEAMRRFGIYRLAARILNLRQRGIQILATYERSRSGARFARYSLA